MAGIKFRMNIFSFCLRVTVILFVPLTVLAQDSLSIDNPQDVESMQKRLEQALLKIDQEKEEKQEALNAQLRQSLNSEIEKWIAAERKARELEVDKIVTSKWDKRAIIGSPFSQDYYLRYYDYVDKVIDIIKSKSVSSPYRGIVKITERLYLEMTHPPVVERRYRFFYIADRPVKLVFECPQDKFVLADVVYSKPSIVRGWPEDLIGKFYTEMKQRGIR